MSVCDPVGDMLARIRNAGRAGHPEVALPHSRLKGEICRVLKKEGFIRDYTTESASGHRVLRLVLKYAADRTPVIRGMRRVSKPGCRRYAATGKLKGVRSGTGMAILTTSSGIMTDRDARRARVGGEVMCHVW